MLNSDAAWSLFSNTNEVLRWIGTARAPVAGSGAAPACSASVSNEGSEAPGMGEFLGCIGRELWAILARRIPPESTHEGQRHPPRQGRHAVHRAPGTASRAGADHDGRVRH